MTFYLWDFMYNALGICLTVVAIIMIYKIYIISKDDRLGTARTG